MFNFGSTKWVCHTDAEKSANLNVLQEGKAYSLSLEQEKQGLNMRIKSVKYAEFD